MASISSASSIDVPIQSATRSSEVKEKSKRPQLSCRNCRLRKVKCDRVQPCTACSLHQIATECTYDLTEQERQPILQAEALRQKDREIEKLRNEVHNLSARTAGHCLPEGPGGPGTKHRSAPHVIRALSTGQVQPYEGGFDDQELMMARSMSVTQELADMTLRQKNPTGRFEDFSGYRLRLSTANSYPFPTLWSADEGVAALYKHLPPRNELLSYLESFEKRAAGVAFPYLPKHCSRKYIDRFLAQLDQHAELRPDVLALIYAAMAQGVLYGAFDRHDGMPSQAAMSQQIGKTNLFMAIAFQALRVSAFLSRPSLCTIETLVMLSQCLCDTGKFVDAWVLIGTTVRLAVLAKFHRHPISVDMEVPQEEQSHKASLWWWLLSLDATSSMVCGRPLGASTTGDCPPADQMGDNIPVSALTGIRNQVTMLCRTVLDQRRFSGSLIQSLTDQLFGVIQSSAAFFPHNFTWQDLPAPSWPLDGQLASIHAHVYTLIILVNQQRHGSRNDHSDPDVAMSYNNVLESARWILRIFKFVKLRIPATLQNWTLCQAAFNAAILLLRGMAAQSITAQGMMNHLSQGDQELVTTTHNIFLSLHEFRTHSLAGPAAARISGLFKDFTDHGCMPGEVLSKDGMALIEGTDLQDTLLPGYEFASGDSDMSSPHEERSSPLGPSSYPTMPAPQQHQQQQQQQQSQNKPIKKTRPGPTAASSLTTARSNPKRNTPRKDKDSSKSRSAHGWSSSESHAMSQGGGRQWSVSKKQHQSSSSSRLGPAPQKPRSRGTGAAASQYISAQSSQYLPSDVLSSFPNPPTGQMATDTGVSAWEELANQMLGSTGSGNQTGQLQHQQQQMHASVPVTMPSAGSHHPTTANAVQGENINASGAAGSHSHSQHVFTSNSHTYSQPQSPALWGFAFNPLTEQGLGGGGQVQDEGGAQGVSQEQQILFPGGVTDPRYFWDLNDESGTQYFWGG